MGEHIVLGGTHIEVCDQDLSTGYQEGYLLFLTYMQGKVFSEAKEMEQ